MSSMEPWCTVERRRRDRYEEWRRLVLNPVLPAWVKADGANSDIVVSTRARLARNLTDAPFPERADREQLDDVAHRVRLASRLLDKSCGPITVLKITDLDEEERGALVDAHLASIDQVESADGRLVILDSKSELAIMVNEEDHLRLQVIVSGFEPERAWSRIDDVDNLLSRKLKFAYSRRYGYLTASLTNAGTGLRLSVMMHLAGLSLTGKLSETLKAAYELGVSVRGLFGEGTKGLGDFFQVSNEVTLGLPETEILGRVRVTADYLLEAELAARDRLIKTEKNKLLEIAGKSIAAAKRCYRITPSDALKLLSPVRMAAGLGMIDGCELRLFNELLVSLGAGRPPGHKKERYHAYEEELKRAVVLRRALMKLKISAN